MELAMFKVGDIITIEDLGGDRKIEVNQEIIYWKTKQIITLQPIEDKKAEDRIMSYSYLREGKSPVVDHIIRLVYWRVIKTEKRQLKRPKAKNKKMAFLRNHNDKLAETDNRLRTHNGLFCVGDYQIKPEIYKEYVSLLDCAIGLSPSLRTLYKSISDVNLFNWVGACGSMGFRPSEILSDYFVIHPFGWWDAMPYNNLKYETEKHKWWFSVFEEYELSSLDFYYPVNPSDGDTIEIIIHYNFGWWYGVEGKTARVKWIHGANGLTIFCLLPHIYMFAIELAMQEFSVSPKRRDAVMKYCYKRMLDFTKIIRSKNAIINF